jgi:formamidopyrimidine-DNA glycosylase
MPELPDVEVFGRYLDRTCKGRVIGHVAVTTSDFFRALQAGLRGTSQRRSHPRPAKRSADGARQASAA